MATKRNTKKTTKPEAEVKGPKPMDDSAPEGPRPTVQVRPARDANSLIALIKEVTDLFPETTYEKGEPNGWNARSSVTFETSGIAGLMDLLVFTSQDERVEFVETDSKEGLVQVSLKPSLRTMDSHEPFGLDEVWGIIGDRYEEGAS